MYFINVGEKFGKNPRHVMEDAIDGFYQLYNNIYLLILFTANVLSIALHLFVGISITKELDATTRVMLDNIRILAIWSISLATGAQAFHVLHFFGFLLFILGVCIYNEILVAPFFRMLWFSLKTGNCRSSRCCSSSESAVDAPCSDEAQSNDAHLLGMKNNSFNSLIRV
jgi:hypothetical protein